ncbi:MAG: hypothetical protein HFG65_01955 [Hungatella sp.]|nr:hypothetical protein [Hungatella sp.]
MKEKIYGYFTRSEAEGELDVTIMIPSVFADFFCVESQWDLILQEDGQDLKWTAIQEMEEQAAGDMEGELFDTFCCYLEDDGNWEGDLEEGEVLEGMDALMQILSAKPYGVFLH